MIGNGAWGPKIHHSPVLVGDWRMAQPYALPSFMLQRGCYSRTLSLEMQRIKISQTSPDATAADAVGAEDHLTPPLAT